MRQTGFSLIELMIALTVMIATVSIGVPSFTNSIGNSQIRTVSESIKYGLQAARVEAIKRNTRVKFTLNNDSSWSYGCNTSSADCPETIQTKNAKEGSSSNIALTITAGNTVVFNSFGLRDAMSTITQIDVTNTSIPSSARKPLRVVVNSGGSAKVCDVSVTTVGDTRKC